MQGPHPLIAWIDERMSRRDFAGQAGTSESHLSLVLQRKAGISLKLAVRIEELTGGEFTAARLFQEQGVPAEAAE